MHHPSLCIGNSIATEPTAPSWPAQDSLSEIVQLIYCLGGAIFSVKGARGEGVLASKPIYNPPLRLSFEIYYPARLIDSIAPSSYIFDKNSWYTTPPRELQQFSFSSTSFFFFFGRKRPNTLKSLGHSNIEVSHIKYLEREYFPLFMTPKTYKTAFWNFQSRADLSWLSGIKIFYLLGDRKADQPRDYAIWKEINSRSPSMAFPYGELLLL